MILVYHYSVVFFSFQYISLEHVMFSILCYMFQPLEKVDVVDGPSKSASKSAAVLAREARDGKHWTISFHVWRESHPLASSSSYIPFIVMHSYHLHLQLK